MIPNFPVRDVKITVIPVARGDDVSFPWQKELAEALKTDAGYFQL
jgi:hypothetical protein